MKKDEKLENTDDSESFWKHNNTIIRVTFLIIAFPSIFIIINLLGLIQFGNDFSLGFNLGNSIALFTASVAISGTFYSNYRNDQRNNQQIKKADERLKDQLDSLKKNLDKQLNHNEKQLEKQLIFDRERDVMLEIYDVLYRNKDAVYYNKKDFEKNVNLISNGRRTIFNKLERIQRKIIKFYFVPEEIRDAILEFVIYINSINQKRLRNDFELFCNDEGNKSEEYLKKIYILTEKYIEIPIRR